MYESVLFSVYRLTECEFRRGLTVASYAKSERTQYINHSNVQALDAYQAGEEKSEQQRVVSEWYMRGILGKQLRVTVTGSQQHIQVGPRRGAPPGGTCCGGGEVISTPSSVSETKSRQMW